MNEFNFFAGIDISKKTFDVALLHAGNPAVIKHACFSKTSMAFISLLPGWLRVTCRYLKFYFAWNIPAYILAAW